jgi:acyl-CoA dehydrogenase
MATIDFELSPKLAGIQAFLHQFALTAMRPAAVIADANEHVTPLSELRSGKPWDVIRQVHMLQRSGMTVLRRHGMSRADEEKAKKEAGGVRGITGVVLAEELAYGAASILLSLPGPGLGGAAVNASGTPAQRDEWLARYEDDEVRFGAMAMTEPNAGSDVGGVETTATRDGDAWVLNGTKIFCTNGASADIVVVWATVDKSLGRAGLKAFVVEKGTPGFRVGRLEKKLGIRASETAELVFEDCRIPLGNMLGDPSAASGETKGFKGAMATFDMTRPGVAAMAVGIARAALEHTVGVLDEAAPFDPKHGRARFHLSALEDVVQEMDAQIEAARLLVHRSAFLLDAGKPNSLEASMAKAKAGRVVVDVTATCVEIVGPAALTRAHPLEMWLRDSKVFDIFEGTGQVQRLVIARKILGYSSKELG